MTARLPAHLEVAAMLRQAGAEGGFAAVLKRGEREAGTILVVITQRGENARIFERMPDLQGGRKWHCLRSQNAENKHEIEDYLTRRTRQDGDLWIIELDSADGERFIASYP